MTYAVKYDNLKYSTSKFYQDIRRKARVGSQIGRLYPNVLDHVVLDDDDIYDELISQVAQSPYVDDAAASIQRFASRCWAADKSEMVVKMMSRLMMTSILFPKPITDVFLFYGAKLDVDHPSYFNVSCLYGKNDVIQQYIELGLNVNERHVLAAISSGNCDTIKLVHSAYRGNYNSQRYIINLANATVQSVELLVSLNSIQCNTHRSFENIPSFSVLQWILDHDVMKHDDVLIDIASNASRYSGHYFDMLRYLVEQRNFTVPRDVLFSIDTHRHKHTDLYVLDFLACHGADVNAVNEYGTNVLNIFPFLIRYWIDRGFVITTNDTRMMMFCVIQGMTAPVLEMMIDKYSMDINAVDRYGFTALHEASRWNYVEIVEMLIRHGADASKRNNDGALPYDMTSDDRIKQLLIQCKC